MGESYNGIHALTDLFADVKIPNKVSGVVAGERLLYLSLNLVGPVCLSFSLQKKFAHCFFCYVYLDPATMFNLVSFCLSLSLPSPPLPMKDYPCTHLSTHRVSLKSYPLWT